MVIRLVQARTRHYWTSGGPGIQQGLGGEDIASAVVDRVAQELCDRVNVCTTHPQPRCCGVPEIVESKIDDSYFAAGSLERNRYFIRRNADKKFFY